MGKSKAKKKAGQEKAGEEQPAAEGGAGSEITGTQSVCPAIPDGCSSGKAEDGTLITYVIPCVSCNAFLSLTKETQLDQICQACKTGVRPLVEKILEDKFTELPLPSVSGGKLIEAVCTGEDCKRTAQFPKGYAIYCPVCLKNVMKEKVVPPKSCFEYYGGERGKQVGEKLEKCCESLGTKPNPAFQLVYVIIMCCWFYLYFRYGWGEESTAIRPLVEEIPGGLNLHMRIMELGFGFGLALLIKCYTCDPGRVTNENREQLNALYKQPDTSLGEIPLKWCNTCRFLRPPRTHHCRICDICVVRFDHHCVWLNTCIGANNLRWFLAFVGWHALLCWYGVGFVFMLMRVIAAKMHAKDPGVLEWVGQRRYEAYMRFIPRTWGMLGGIVGNAAGTDVPWSVVWAMNVPLMVLMIFCAVMGALLGSFFFVHVLQVLRNQTSYEGWTYVPQKQDPDGAASDATDGAAAESCTPPPAPTAGKANASASSGVDKSVEVKNEAPKASNTEKQKDEATGTVEEEEAEDEPDRGSTCRIKRQDPPKEEGGGLPPGQWVSKHDTGSKFANISEVLFPPMNSFSAVAQNKKEE